MIMTLCFLHSFPTMHFTSRGSYRIIWQVVILATQTLFWFGHGCSGDRAFWEHERYHALGMDAVVTPNSGNTNVMMVWA